MLNKEDFEHIFNFYYRSLCKYLLLFTDDYEMIEDTIQSIFVKLWEEKDTISINYIKTYLFASAKNRILNSIRDQQKRKDLLQDYFINELTKEQADEIVNIDEFISLVEKSVDELPPKTKSVYCLSRYNNMSYKEIANQEDISVKTVEAHISKALQRIKNQLSIYYKKMLSVFL
ncbi:RNA polymerase sigma-70 factor (family 1) [Dysgonomonas sp. PFB1-18]|uniref:RNA polymerase sigma-70 factor n=1 Tax=unclassified Dysgonomonas TaxID=2630389 RepID=UPI0024752AFD|nr:MULTISPECIES: RNA polymerase sigma-70 factor [unclassified Dysgonomonas]MDH6308787.1 RNA polymerase sigma-70 factor (family 1) [Dysgonomonas sp. PF1-14]MDH6338516.1 RNA polymerase sigma-70 factor (family 1) [Dysgonomonas sp. PF1-16]MDH6380036.1 RNA polymerase sigma-70 factor (family 1) [Dysgonomonas sp. PFB1-18]MDH6397344.1 RNA polymerase sigma-70 factor (family 1) [Dysgonomonas sp. PF1-23]